MYFYFLKKNFLTCLIIQSVFCIAFAMNQVPAFLMKMQGFNFGWQNLFILLGLGILEFFNVFTLFSFLLSVLYHFWVDFKFFDLRIFLIQIRLKSYQLFFILFFSCFCYASFFVFNDLFIVPYSNIFFKKKALEIYKNKIFYSIQPRHVVFIPEIALNVSVAKKINNHLVGSLVHLESYNLFFIVQHLFFEKKQNFQLELTNCRGKVLFDFDTLFFTFESGEIEANPDVIVIADKVSFYNLTNWHELFLHSKIFLVTLLIAFFVFGFTFSQSLFGRFFLILAFIPLVADALTFISLTYYFLILFYFFIVFYFGRVISCLNF